MHLPPISHQLPAGGVDAPRLTFFGVVLLILVLACTPAAAQTGEPLIKSVQVIGKGEIDEAEIAEILELEVGSIIDRGRLREVITTLYAGGQVEWLKVESTEVDGGLDVVVRISLQSTISQIKVFTKKPLLRVKVHRWLQMEPGDPVTTATIENARRRVERRLQERGHADALVEAFINYDRGTNTVVVEIHATPGSPQVVGSVVVEGAENEEIETVAEPKHKVGKRLTLRLEERLRYRTESNLREMGFWEAEVLEVERRAEGADVELAMRVDTGPRYRLELEAPAEKEKLAQKAFPDPSEEELHPAQTEALAEQVQEHLQEAGYLLARVSAELTTDGDERVLLLRVDPGLKLKIQAVEFPGAEHVANGKLQQAVAVKQGGAGGRFQQMVSSATIEDDRRQIEQLYHGEGFPFVVVATGKIVATEEPQAVRVVFAIDEGTRWLISEVRIEGLPVEAAADLDTNPMHLVAGSPWSPSAVDRAQQRLENALADTGYPEGRVEADVDTTQEGKALVTFRIEPGPFVRVGEVIIAGLRHTRESIVAGVVRRAGVRTGEPLSRAKMLEAQRGLFELGLFRRAELVPMPGQERREDRNIVVRIDEGEQKSYLFGLGYSDRDAARLILGWSHLNLLGRAYAFAAEVSLSNRQQRYSLSLRKQRAFGLPVPAHLAIYRTNEVLADRDLLRRGLWLDFGDRLNRPLRPWLRYEYEIIEHQNVPEDLPPIIDDEFAESKVASLTPSVEWDTRDNLLSPTRGIYATVSLQYAFPAFQADNHFLKFRVGGTLYKPLGGGFAAVGLKLGAIKPLYGDDGLPENLQIPFAYRFFAGGRTTHRAFAIDALGIPGQTIIDGNPIGGNALVLLNLEYRYSIAGQLFAAIFLDAGNIWASPNDVNLGEIRWGPGLGIQYWTPAGPLRAEYGWKLDPAPGEASGQFYVSFGVPF